MKMRDDSQSEKATGRSTIPKGAFCHVCHHDHERRSGRPCAGFPSPGDAGPDKSVDDVLWLDNAAFTKIGSNGKLKADAFHVAKQAADPEDRIIYNQATGTSATMQTAPGHPRRSRSPHSPTRLWLPSAISWWSEPDPGSP
jgi:hypothetical protein